MLLECGGGRDGPPVLHLPLSMHRIAVGLSFQGEGLEGGSNIAGTHCSFELCTPVFSSTPGT